eukprot:s185_g41.t1
MNQERVFVPRRHMKALDLPAEILFQDESLIAVAKPAGKSSEDCASMQDIKALGSHRFADFAGNQWSAEVGQLPAAALDASWWFLAQFAGRIVSKKYLCLATGDVGLPGYTEDIKLPLQGGSLLDVSLISESHGEVGLLLVEKAKLLTTLKQACELEDLGEERWIGDVSMVRRLLHGRWPNVVALCEDQQETQTRWQTAEECSQRA